VEKVLEENPKFVQNGNKSIKIKDKSGIWNYMRQQLINRKENTKKVRKVPIDEFLGIRKRGLSHVSRSLEKDTLQTVTENSYRKTEKINNQNLKKDAILARVLARGERAKKLDKTQKKVEPLSEREARDAGSEKDSYKKNKGGRIRRIFGKIFNWNRLYFMTDGVGVQGQDKKEKKWTGSKECKVGAIIHQSGEQLREMACFCTWERITGFRSLVEWTLLPVVGIVGLFNEIVIISDGAKWIRNMRVKIACLFGAIWILDWFHTKDRTEACLRVLGIKTDGKLDRKIKSLLWLGEVDKVIKKIKQIRITGNEETKEKKKAARKSLIEYLKNQREGIVNYHQMQMRGYLVGSGFVEKRNDTLVKNRMVRQKRMRWSQTGGEAMMQILTAQMNGRFDELFA